MHIAGRGRTVRQSNSRLVGRSDGQMVGRFVGRSDSRSVSRQGGSESFTRQAFDGNMKRYQELADIPCRQRFRERHHRFTFLLIGIFSVLLFWIGQLSRRRRRRRWRRRWQPPQPGGPGTIALRRHSDSRYARGLQLQWV